MKIDSVHVTRDSLGAADEIKAPHEYCAKIHTDSTAQDLIIKVFKQLRTVDQKYNTATWAITSIRPLAVISPQWDAPRMLLRSVRRVEDLVMIRGTTAHLHFCRYQDCEPEALYRVLDNLRFPYLHESQP